MLTRKDDILVRIVSNIKFEFRGFSINGEPSACWEWQGANSGTHKQGGYGRISISGVTCAVHRVVYTHFYGFIPSKRHVDHLCKNRLCCNPEHLELVTHLENQRRKNK